jgi:hypothetical protein
MPPTSGILKKQEVIDNLLTSTWYDVRKTLQKDIFQITPFYDMMIEKGRIKERAPDGTHFEIPFAYAHSSQNLQWFGRGAKFGKEEKEFMTRMTYQTRNFGDNIIRYWDDERKNKGKARILSYVDEVIDNHSSTMSNGLAVSMWTSGGSLAINTLPELITTTPTTGSIGGIARSENPYLQNIAVNFTGLSFSTALLLKMENVFNTCSIWKSKKGNRAPDMIITTQLIYEAYQDLARALGIYEFNSSDRRVELGMGLATFKGAPLTWDPECPKGHMYFLNSSSLEFAYDPDNWFEMTDWKSEADSLDRMAQVVCVGNLVANNFRKNAVIFNIVTTG